MFKVLIITIIIVYLLNRVLNKNKYKYWIIALTIAVGLIFINLFQPYLKHKKIIKKQRDKG